MCFLRQRGDDAKLALYFRVCGFKVFQRAEAKKACVRLAAQDGLGDLFRDAGFALKVDRREEMLGIRSEFCDFAHGETVVRKAQRAVGGDALAFEV